MNMVLALTMLAAAPQEAAPQAQPPERAAEKGPEVVVQGETEKQAQKRVVCRRAVATGSFIPRVTCHTRADWDQQTQRSLAQLDRTQREAVSRTHVQASRDAR